MMVRHSRRGVHHCLFLGLLFFSISGYCSDALKSTTTSEIQSAFRFDFPESSWVLTDLDGDHAPDFATGQRLGRSTDGYSYRIQLQLSSESSSSSFTVFHNNVLGLRITGVDIDGDDDIDLVISGSVLPPAYRHLAQRRQRTLRQESSWPLLTGLGFGSGFCSSRSELCGATHGRKAATA